MGEYGSCAKEGNNMVSLKMYIFNIGRGFSCFVRSPSNETLLIDCGCSDEFSPIDYIHSNILSSNISKLTITHPHNDHIREIENVWTKKEPNTLLGRDYDWESLKEPGIEYKALDYYANLKANYYTETSSHSHRGMNLNHYFPKKTKAIEIDAATQAFLNNTSILSTLEYQNKKFLFTGDIQNEMWAILLEEDTFLEFIEGTKIVIAPHHGLDSAFYPGLYDHINPWISLISERSGESPNSGYSSEDYFSGIEYKDKIRRSFTTRLGTIYVEVREDGWWLENQDM